MKARVLLCSALLMVFQSITSAPSLAENERDAVVAAATTTGTVPWWQRAVFYEIYPRSFADTNNDGIGDIRGITSKLDYLKSIGVGAIWITPCFPSPQVDFGYDISDYKNIAREYGTMADFDQLLTEAKARDIKIILDFVMNHTSDKHPWFIESRAAKSNPKRDWFVWRDGKNGGPPNNWQALFGHSAWQFDSKTNQYYYHFFYPQQPDLNWRNPDVRRAMYDTAKFWLDKGVAGFRLDAVNTLYEVDSLPDNPIKPGGKVNRFGDPEMENKYNYLLPEIHDALRELRNELNQYSGHRVLIGETTDSRSIADLARMYGLNDDEIQLPMNFMFAFINKLAAPEFRKQIAAADKNPANGWPVYLFSNHDEPRAYNRYGDGTNNDDAAKILATLLYTLRGTPILYYGEEIGMANNDPKRITDVKDPIGKLGWPAYKGRDGERTPMQWTPAVNAGFSAKKPWLPVGPQYKTHNVQTESKDPASVLSFYRELARLRSTRAALQGGEYIALNQDDPNILSYIRRNGDDRLLIAVNMSNQARSVSFDLSPLNIEATRARPLVSNKVMLPCSTEYSLKQIPLPPYAVLVAEVR